jgi:hypothetical protein
MVGIPKYRHHTFCWVNDNFNQIGTNVKKWVFVFQSLLWLTEGQNIILLWLTGDSILGTENHIAMDKQGILFHNFDIFVFYTKPIKKNTIVFQNGGHCLMYFFKLVFFMSG